MLRLRSTRTGAGARPLTAGEVALARPLFGDAVDYAAARIAHRAWWPLQPRDVAMAPSGCIHFHPKGSLYRDDFAAAPLNLQALFLHELTHVWQAQRSGRLWLPLMRHPFCRYDYALAPGKPFAAYGIEQQAEIVRHAFLLGRGATLPGATTLDAYLPLLRQVIDGGGARSIDP